MNPTTARIEREWSGIGESFARVGRVKDTSYKWPSDKSAHVEASKLPPRYSEIRALFDDLVDDSEEMYGASFSINAISCRKATQFLSYLPSDIPLPEVWCEPSGIVIANWLRSKSSAAIAFEEADYGVVGYNSQEKDFIKKITHSSRVLDYVRFLLD